MIVVPHNENENVQNPEINERINFLC